MWVVNLIATLVILPLSCLPLRYTRVSVLHREDDQLSKSWQGHARAQIIPSPIYLLCVRLWHIQNGWQVPCPTISNYTMNEKFWRK
jgi:hypothetical protein